MSSLSNKSRSAEDAKRYELQIFYWKVKAIPPWVDRCYQRELARQEELKLALESQHILWPHKTVTGEYTLKLLTWWWTLLTSGLTSQALIRMQNMESLLIKILNSQDKSEELKSMEKLYNDDVICQCQPPRWKFYKCCGRMVIIFALTTS